MKTNKTTDNFGFNWDALCCLPPIQSLSTKEEENNFHTQVRAVEAKMNGFHPLSIRLQNVLRQGHYRVIFEEPISVIEFRLTRKPCASPFYFESGMLVSEAKYDPLELKDLSSDREVFGGVVARLAYECIEKCNEVAEFPYNEMKKEVADFAASGFANRLILSNGTLHGIKYRVEADMSSESTKAWLELEYGASQKTRKLIYEESGAKPYEIAGLKDVFIDRNGVTVGNDYRPYLLRIDWSDFPGEVVSEVGRSLE